MGGLIKSTLAVLLAACTAPPGLDPNLAASIEELADRLVIRIGGEVFTEYRFLERQKYPYFYPVNGPTSGQSITTESSEPYPHHHSLFFACDRVNGGNYWQEGLGRGQTRQERIRVKQGSGRRVSFVSENVWHRPGAPAPFRDRRTVTVFAPREHLRVIDVEIAWTAQEDVRIARTNHALFSARVVKAMAVSAGGSLVNAEGASGEKATFGKRSPWMDYSGKIAGPRSTLVEGIAILTHPDNPLSPSPWFTRDYGFFSPTPMHWLPGGRLDIKKGKTLTLRYRVIVHAGSAADAGIAELYDTWCREGQ
jgi:Family of unknown function (DUF6807)